MNISKILPTTSSKRNKTDSSTKPNLTSFNGNKEKQISFNGKWGPYNYGVYFVKAIGTNGSQQWDFKKGNIGEYRPYSWESRPTEEREVLNSGAFSHTTLYSSHPDFEAIKPSGYLTENARVGTRLTREESLFDQALKTTSKSKEKWLKAEAETLKNERLKGALIDISVQDLPEANSPMEIFLKKAKANPLDTKWVEGKLVATPKATKRAADIVMEAFGFAEHEIKSLSTASQSKTISSFLKESNFVETVMKHVANIVKI